MRKLCLLISVCVSLLFASVAQAQQAKTFKLRKVASIPINNKMATAITSQAQLARMAKADKNKALPKVGYSAYKLEGQKMYVVVRETIDIASLIMKSEILKQDYADGTLWIMCGCSRTVGEGVDQCKIARNGAGAIDVSSDATACSGTCGDGTCVLTLLFTGSSGGTTVIREAPIS